MPAHNEEDIIAAAVTEWHAEVIAKIPGSRLLVIDDASTDGTPEVLGQLTRSLPGIDFTPPRCEWRARPALLFGFRQVEQRIRVSDGQRPPALSG